MGAFADELRAGIDEAVRKMAEARLAGDNYGAEAYRERLSFLRRVAARHGLGPWPSPDPVPGPPAAPLPAGGRGPVAGG
jgi:hypothetical protein